MSEEEIHPIFSKDPEEWMQLVYKKVNVKTEDGLEHVGIVYTIDPVSETYILINFVDDHMNVKMVFGHAVISVTVLGDNTDVCKYKLDNLFRPPGHEKLSVNELKRKQNTTKLWLLKNRLPVEVGGTGGELLIIADALVIQPPYGPENCVSTNEIILGKIQGLIKSMPEGQDEW